MKCVIDGVTELEAGQVCRRCEYREADRLDQIVTMHAQLGDWLEPGTTAVQRVSGSREAPLPLRVDVLDLAAPARVLRIRGYFDDQMGEIAVASVLDSWVRDWIDLRSHGGRGENLPVPVVATLAVWLRNRLPWAVVEHLAIDEYSGEIQALWYSLRRAVGDMPVHPERLWTPCRDCEQLTLARHPGEDRPIRCVNCRLAWTEDDYNQWTKLVAAGATRAA